MKKLLVIALAVGLALILGSGVAALATTVTHTFSGTGSVSHQTDVDFGARFEGGSAHMDADYVGTGTQTGQEVIWTDGTIATVDRMVTVNNGTIHTYTNTDAYWLTVSVNQHVDATWNSYSTAFDKQGFVYEDYGQDDHGGNVTQAAGSTGGYRTEFLWDDKTDPDGTSIEIAQFAGIGGMETNYDSGVGGVFDNRRYTEYGAIGAGPGRLSDDSYAYTSCHFDNVADTNADGSVADDTDVYNFQGDHLTTVDFDNYMSGDSWYISFP